MKAMVLNHLIHQLIVEEENLYTWEPFIVFYCHKLITKSFLSHFSCDRARKQSFAVQMDYRFRAEITGLDSVFLRCILLKSLSMKLNS